MENSIAMQLYILLIFTISGIAIGVLFDIFRILRKSFKTPDYITYIEDIVFWILSGAIFLFTLFKFNNGEIRSYVIIGVLIGIVAYMLTISKYFISLNVKIITIVKNIILYPIKLIWKITKKILKPLSFTVVNIRKNFRNMLNKIVKTTKKNKKTKKN